MRKKEMLLLPVLLLCPLFQASLTAAFADPLQGGIEQKQYTDPLQGGTSGYGAPQMVPQTPMMQQPPPVRPLRGNANTSAPRQPIQLQVEKVVLPPGFMGAWQVQGKRTKVEALPEFQAGAEQAFSPVTSNVWNINGNPGNYSMSNGQMSTQFWVDKVEGGTAFIRYQHPVGNTMAQEAIVMSLVPGGAHFNGLERISIVKQGLPQPRAKVTYQLSGNRQR